MKTKYKYIEFEKLEELNGTIWRCRNRYETILGYMVYVHKWSEWEFQPEPDTGYTIACCRDIADFLDQLNKEGKP